MFFPLSKIGFLLVQPISQIAGLLVLGLLMRGLGWRRTAIAAFSLAALAIALYGYTNIGRVALQPLEARYAQRTDRAGFDGIILLTGGMNSSVNRVRKGIELGESGDRLVEALALLQANPDARLVISGGNAGLLEPSESETIAAKRFFERFGMEPGRITLEDRSRNTAESAGELAAMFPGGLSGRWALVTSAFHMPRSMALMEKAGLAVEPWPSDFRTDGATRFGLAPADTAANMAQASLAIREWLGLFVYDLTGRI